MGEREDEKSVAWLGDSRSVVRESPAEARAAIGRSLYRVQLGLAPVHWRPMPTVGRGVREIRVRIRNGGRTDYRLFYVATFPEAVYVLHAFQKAARKTARTDLRVGRQRFTELQAIRRHRRQTDGD